MPPQLTRRQWLTATAGAALMTGCRSQSRSIVPARVSILKVPAYDQTVYDTVHRLLVEHLGSVRGRNILLKPNLVEFEPASSINTHPDRKSTRLNSSHRCISYAVFCLKQ